jgi:hypothetical protein
LQAGESGEGYAIGDALETGNWFAIASRESQAIHYGSCPNTMTPVEVPR